MNYAKLVIKRIVSGSRSVYCISVIPAFKTWVQKEMITSLITQLASPANQLGAWLLRGREARLAVEDGLLELPLYGRPHRRRHQVVPHRTGAAPWGARPGTARARSWPPR